MTDQHTMPANANANATVTPSALEIKPRPRIVDSQTLLSGATQLLIRHQGEMYRLQTTRLGKLILTK